MIERPMGKMAENSISQKQQRSARKQCMGYSLNGADGTGGDGFDEKAFQNRERKTKNEDYL